MIQENYINTMAADDLAPCVARTSAAMVLIIQYTKNVLEFHDGGWFQQQASYDPKCKYSAVPL